MKDGKDFFRLNSVTNLAKSINRLNKGKSKGRKLLINLSKNMKELNT